MDALKEETDKEKAEKAKLAEEKLKIEADMLEAERERQELIRIQVIMPSDKTLRTLYSRDCHILST
jgi:hypothetical protein